MMLDASVLFIDVREINETPVVANFNHVKLPLSGFKGVLKEIKEEKIVLFCQSGKRSLIAARMISEHYGNSKKVYSLKDGIVAWKNLRRV